MKCAQELASSGYNVKVLAWDRLVERPKTEKINGYTAHRFHLRAPLGYKVILFMPLWWIYIIYMLIRNRNYIIHAFDLDTALPAILFARLTNKPVVYEIADVYEDILPLPDFLRNLILKLDKKLMRLANSVIVPGEGMIEQLHGIPNKNITIIYNSPRYIFEKDLINENKDKPFTIFFAGAIFKNRLLNLDKVYDAIKEVDNVKLVIAGYGTSAGEIIEWAERDPQKVCFIGKLCYTDVIKNTHTADLLISLYSPSLKNTKYMLTNKLFEAMACSKPILASKGTATALVIEKASCGIVVDCESTKDITAAILKLKNTPELCEIYGNNGKISYDKEYSWSIMRERLLNIYNTFAMQLSSRKGH